MVGTLVVVLMSVGLAQAPAPTVQDRIDRAKAAIDNLEYQTAADELMIAATDPEASLEERLEANLYAGIANRIIERDVDARLNFAFVLKHRPDQQLPPDTPPKITSFYELVRQEVEMTRRPAVAPAPASTAPPDEAPPPSARVEGPADPTAQEVASSGQSEPRESGLGWQVVTGSGMLAVGVAALGVAAVVAGTGELLLALPTADAGLKTVAQYAGLAALGVAVLPAVIALSGAGLLTWGLIE